MRKDCRTACDLRLVVFLIGYLDLFSMAPPPWSSKTPWKVRKTPQPYFVCLVCLCISRIVCMVSTRNPKRIDPSIIGGWDWISTSLHHSACSLVSRITNVCLQWSLCALHPTVELPVRDTRPAAPELFNCYIYVYLRYLMRLGENFFRQLIYKKCCWWKLEIHFTYIDIPI